jgi:hypothetical protein
MSGRTLHNGGMKTFGPALSLLFLCVMAALPATAHPAWGIVVNRAGELYFSDIEAIWKIDHAGKLSLVRPGVNNHHVHELAIDAQGNVYGPDYEYISESDGYRTGLWKMEPSGRTTYITPPAAQLPRGLGIWRDLEGNSYAVEDNQHVRRETLLIRRTPDGRASVFAGSGYGLRDGTGAQALFGHVLGIAFGPDRALYLADGGAVRRVSLAGAVVTTLGRGYERNDPAAREPLDFGSLMGITVSPTSDVYVADFKNRRVIRIAANGQASVVLRAEPPWSPTGVALAPNGDLYVLEFGFRPPGTWIKPRVRRLSAAGGVNVVAAVGER